MLLNPFIKPNRKIAVGIVLGFILFFGFQNCSRTEKNFKMDHIDQSSNVTTVEVSVTEHPIELKTVTTDYTLQLADRNYLEGIFSDAFGPSAADTVRENIVLKHDDLGGPCSEYAYYKKLTGKTYADKDRSLLCDEDNTTKVLIPPATAVRQGWILQTCATLTGTDTNPPSLAYILGKIKTGATPANLPLPNTENLANLHKLFYREHPLPPDSVFEALRLMFHGDSPTINEWKTAIYSYCVSPHWQVL